MEEKLDPCHTPLALVFIMTSPTQSLIQIGLAQSIMNSKKDGENHHQKSRISKGPFTQKKEQALGSKIEMARAAPNLTQHGPEMNQEPIHPFY